MSNSWGREVNVGSSLLKSVRHLSVILIVNCCEFLVGRALAKGPSSLRIGRSCELLEDSWRRLEIELASKRSHVGSNPTPSAISSALNKLTVLAGS